MKLKYKTSTLTHLLPFAILIAANNGSLAKINFPPPMLSPKSSLSAAEYNNGHLRAHDAAQRVKPRLQKQLKTKGLKLGSPVFLRIFKQSRELEVWIQTKNGQFALFKTYEIAAASGVLGPKKLEGDRQAPEGFYYVAQRHLNPQSRFHLSLNIGYPNKFDRAHDYTGSAIMIHGNRVSIGCFAMTDYYIEEIYTLCTSALDSGQPIFRIHSFPFRLTNKNLNNHKSHPALSFWKNLQPGFNYFEKTKTPPNIIAENGKYTIETTST